MAYVFWDFDGTLVEHRSFGTAMAEVLDVRLPGHGLTKEHFSPYLQEGFVWQTWEEGHPQLDTPEAWWNHHAPYFERAYRMNGFSAEQSRLWTGDIPEAYNRSSRFRLFPDSLAALGKLREQGIHTAVVSNFSPGLELILEDLGLMPYLDFVVNSYDVGYEKPRPEIYREAMVRAREGPFYMVGDNPRADVRGAENAGIRGILIRKNAAGFKSIPTALEAAEWILNDLSGNGKI